MGQFLFVAALVSGVFVGTAAAQVADDVYLPRIEVGASMSWRLARDPSVTPRRSGAVFAANANLSNHLAIGTEVSGSPGTRAILAGPRVSTGYYRDGAGQIPGRFFAQALIGAQNGHAGSSGVAMVFGAGADALIVPTGLSIHWALDYVKVPPSALMRSGARLSVGIVVGI